MLRLSLGFAIALLVCTRAAQAQDSPFMMDPGAFANHMAIQPMTKRLERDHRIVFGQSVDESLHGSATVGQAVSTVVAAASYSRRRTDVTLQRMAAPLPAPQREQAIAAFRELLSKYTEIERRFGIPARDVAGAVAAYIAGCHMAFHNTPFPDADFKPLVAQMRRTLATNPDFARLPASSLQDLYDEMALGGMLMATAQMANQARPDAAAIANLRETAGHQLQSFLGTEPDRVRITGSGLQIRQVKNGSSK